MPVVFVNPLVNAPAKRASGTILQMPGHDFIKLREDQVVGVKNLQVLRLGGEIQAAIEITEGAQILWIDDELDRQALKFFTISGVASVERLSSTTTGPDAGFAPPAIAGSAK